MICIHIIKTAKGGLINVFRLVMLRYHESEYWMVFNENTIESIDSFQLFFFPLFKITTNNSWKISLTELQLTELALPLLWNLCQCARHGPMKQSAPKTKCIDTRRGSVLRKQRFKTHRLWKKIKKMNALNRIQ